MEMRNMKYNHLSLEFVNDNFYNVGELIYRKDGRNCTNRITDYGYYMIWFKRQYQSHRILWMLYNQQEIPEGYIVDHRDGNKLNNSKENLRLATRSQNNQNAKTRKDNITGIKGIFIKNNKNKNVYKCKINKDKKTYQKCFKFTEEGLELAKKWLEEKRIELHGEFARS